MKLLLSFIAAASVAAASHAQHAGDILLTLEAGRIATNSEPEAGLSTPERVFASEFGEFEPRFTDEPGFDGEIGTFPFPSDIGFRIRGPLLRWDGTKAVGADPQQLAIAFASLGPAITPACNITIDGFSLSVGSNGTWHRHLEFTLDEAAPTGVYILELELFSTSPAVDDSEPFWIVFNHESSEEDHDAATDWAREHVAAIPCRADFDRDGSLGVADIFAFLTGWFAGPASTDHWRTDFDGSCTSDVADIFSFLSEWFGACC